jgi:hypothetical protein
VKELMKHTPPEHPDYKGLQETTAKVKDVTEKINQLSRETENREQILSIQSRFISKVEV